MVLLEGLNYDYSGQVETTLSTANAAAAVTLAVTNTEGFATADYMVIDPMTEIAEVVKITTVTPDTAFAVPAMKFAHAVDAKIYRLPFNQMKFYTAASTTATFVVIAASTMDMDYATNYTNYTYAAASSGLYYKRTFYNETTLVESDIALANYWTTSEESLYITPEELRVLLQFDNNDFPNPQDMRAFILFSQIKVDLDVSSTDANFLKFATFLLSKYYVMRGLATRSVSKGYITVNAEGRQVTKAFQELVLEGENTFQEYKEFIRANNMSEVTSTNFMADSTIINASTRQQFIDMWDSTQNAMDYDNLNNKRYGRITRG
jgi:hypothetical protein